MKKTIATIILCSVLTALFSIKGVALPTPPGVSAKAAILVDGNTGNVFHELNADARMQIASTTKILTALVVLDNCQPDEEVTIKKEWTGVEGSSIYLQSDETLTVKDLLYGLMLKSGNDAAVALACYTAGSVEKFAELMNAKAVELGCENSSFKNPHGLDQEDHYSTARDLGKITGAALKNETLSQIVSTKFASAGGRSLKNNNRLLWDIEGTVGVKTGYTKSSGRSLVSCVERKGMQLICVTLSDPNDWADHGNLYNWVFDSFESVVIEKGKAIDFTVPVVAGVKAKVSLMTGEELSFHYDKDKEYTLSVDVPKFAYAVVVKGGYAGELIVKVDDEVVGKTPVFYAETVRQNKAEQLTLWEQIKRSWYKANEHSSYQWMGYY